MDLSEIMLSISDNNDLARTSTSTLSSVQLQIKKHAIQMIRNLIHMEFFMNQIEKSVNHARGEIAFCVSIQLLKSTMKN